MSKSIAQVMLVNSEDEDIGLFPKLEAHRAGLLHRAFSIFVFNSKDELLLQKRASAKYHSPGLWTNTCCSHPLLKSDIKNEAKKRLLEEMGFVCDLTFCFKFIYNAKIDNLIEHELDYVFIGRYDETPSMNSEEVADFRYVSLEQIDMEMEENAERYTSWFKICYNRLKEHYNLIKLER